VGGAVGSAVAPAVGGAVVQRTGSELLGKASAGVAGAIAGDVAVQTTAIAGGVQEGFSGKQLALAAGLGVGGALLPDGIVTPRRQPPTAHVVEVKAGLGVTRVAEVDVPLNPGTPASPSARLSPSNYPVPDPPLAAPPVRYEPRAVDEVIRMRKGKGPTTKADQGDRNIEAHHRGQQPASANGVIDELEQRTHRGPGNHTRHSGPTQLTPTQRAAEIRDHWRGRGAEYMLPGEGI